MTAALVELASTAAPLALSMAVVLAGARVREVRRRRDLNRSLHELRRPLQALLLGGRRDHLESAIEALGELDRRVNGEPERPAPRPVDGRSLVAAACDRWRDAARFRGGDLSFDWGGGLVTLDADPSWLARALDNLLANAVEHGGGRVQVRASLCPGGLRIRVLSGGGEAMTRRGPRPRDPRRGHGLAIAREIARVHRGSLDARARADGFVAALELPVRGQRSPRAVRLAAAR